jgi:tRNA A-37 threonylcarbamoyl transferase component Bud32
MSVERGILAGTRFGRYELLSPLGRGGMAEVFLARYLGPEGFEKRLVIKRVLPKLANDRQLLRMFFEEARTHVSLSQSNLVAVFDFGRVGNDYFIAMEYVAGVDLATLIGAERAAGRRLSPEVVAYLGIELCRALGYVHRRSLVHRDVSARNVLVSVDGEVKLSDFGLVLPATAAQKVRGTLAYTPPEQARGEAVDGRGDLFSLGLVLAEAVLGERLRDGGADDRALEVARAGEPVSVDGPLAELIRRATQTAPGDRFGDADQMAAALESRVGSREAAVRELAARVAAATPARKETGAGADAPVATLATAPEDPEATRPLAEAAGETYFRGHDQSTVINDILRTPVPRRRWRSAAAASSLALVALALVAGGLAWRSRAAREHLQTAQAATAAVLAPPVAAPSPPPAVVEQPHPTAPPPRAHRNAPAKAEPKATKVAAVPGEAPTATLLVHCQPWCDLYVDGDLKGEGHLRHSVVLPAGSHRVEARRIGDRSERSVELQPNQSQTVEFKFD